MRHEVPEPLSADDTRPAVLVVGAMVGYCLVFLHRGLLYGLAPQASLALYDRPDQLPYVLGGVFGAVSRLIVHSRGWRFSKTIGTLVIAHLVALVLSTLLASANLSSAAGSPARETWTGFVTTHCLPILAVTFVLTALRASSGPGLTFKVQCLCPTSYGPIL